MNSLVSSGSLCTLAFARLLTGPEVYTIFFWRNRMAQKNTLQSTGVWTGGYFFMERFFWRCMFSKKDAREIGTQQSGRDGCRQAMTMVSSSVLRLPLHGPGGFKDKIDDGRLRIV